MTAVSVIYILMAEEGLRLSADIGYHVGAAAAAAAFVAYCLKARKM